MKKMMIILLVLVCTISAQAEALISTNASTQKVPFWELIAIFSIVFFITSFFQKMIIKNEAKNSNNFLTKLLLITLLFTVLAIVNYIFCKDTIEVAIFNILAYLITAVIIAVIIPQKLKSIKTVRNEVLIISQFLFIAFIYNREYPIIILAVDLFGLVLGLLSIYYYKKQKNNKRINLHRSIGYIKDFE